MIINEKYFKEYSPIPINYNLKELKNYISVAEEIWIKPLIGVDLFDEIQLQIDENSLTPENQALLTEGKLWQYLCFATCYEGLVFIWANISEVGITKGKSDNSDSLTLKDITYVQQHLRQQVEFLKDSVKKYICEHSDYFPLADYCACGCSCCGEKAKLNKPNPMLELYTTRRKNTNLK